MAKKKDNFEDISSYSKGSGFKYKADNAKQRAKKKINKSSKKSFKAVFCVLVGLIIVVSALGGAYVRKVLSLINHDAGNNGNPDATFVDDTEEDLNFSTIYDVESADSIKDLIKSWALNGGEKMYSKNVINVLLIGEDNDDGSHRSDSCILASVNTKTKKISLVSFLRDTYTYMDINGSERYDKTNHSYSWGGAAKLMEVLSNNYKIKIDYYVSINFESFKKVIDILGGVTVPITEKEAAFMNRTTKCKGFEAGEAVTLNGERALIYSRIRKLDSEIERTRRQRCVINSVISNFKASSLSDLNKAIETFLPYVTTNMKTAEILSYGTQALRENWLSFRIEGMVEPSEDIMVGVSGFRTYTGYLDVWIADYVKAAREVQLALYNNTNIEIDPETHISAIDLLSTSQKSDADYYGDNNNNDDEEDTTRKRIISDLIENWERPTLYSKSNNEDENNNESEDENYDNYSDYPYDNYEEEQ